MQIVTIIRICTSCKLPLAFNKDGHQEGYLCCDEYYCSKRCLDVSFEGTDTDWEHHFEEDGDCYFTEWELEELE